MKKKQFDQLFRMLQASVQQAQQPSPWETAVGNEYNQINSFLNSKDYRNLPPGVNIDMLSLADSNRMRQMMRGQNAGQSATGINPQMQAAQRELSDNQFQQEWGGEYERKVGDLMGRKDNMLSFLQGGHTNRMNTGISGNLSLLQAAQMRPKGSFWGDMFKGLIPGLASTALKFI